MLGPVVIHECDDEEANSWDTFVEAFSGSYCQRFAWKGVFERAYRLRTHYLAFVSDGVWLGVLPLAVMPTLPGMTRRAVSLPYCNYGGLLPAGGIDADRLKALAAEFMAAAGVDVIEFRELAASDVAGEDELTMILALPDQVEQLWKQVGAKVRNQVRKAQRAGLELRWGRDQGRVLHEIYAKNMGRLGTPVHSLRFVKEILACFPNDADVLTVRLEGRPIGAMLIVKNGVVWADPFASCLAEFNHLNPNMLMYWEALRAACVVGVQRFDFGRSYKESGTYRFKKQWGAQEVALDYHTYHNGIVQLQSSATFYRAGGALQLASVWRSLPVTMQMLLGPSIRRWLP